MTSRRGFIKQTGIGSAGLALALSTKSFGSIIGANDRANIAVMGTNSRGGGLMINFINQDNTRVTHICDVDTNVIERTTAKAKELQGHKPKGMQDIRKVLENKDIDILVIAAPDHWHTPAALMGLQAGKHIYVEKPCGHNPYEGEMLVEAQKKYGKLVQMGNQQRSGPPTMQAIKDIRDGVIGKPYFGKAWYANTRGPIGRGKSIEVPDWLNYDLWQGPAPRVEYKDNLVHYNWHWFWNWGTGEICNNGTHEVDVCRWALGVDYPTRVTSSGGRYQFDDDWEFYDTQIASWDFDEGKTITWEGMSCNGKSTHERGRGSTIHGTEGTILVDRNTYILWDKAGKKVKELTSETMSSTMDLVGAGGNLTENHIANLLGGIRDGATLASPILEGHKSTLLCHLGNIAQETGRTLQCDPSNGHIKDDPEAEAMWKRDYEKGWEPTV